MPRKNIFSYILDHGYSLMRFNPACMHPMVVRGYFAQSERGYLQQLFFQELLNLGFQRTVWQLVLPGQTAGLVCKVENPESEFLYQYHVRFYDDGTIDCEYEPHNFSLHHLSGDRIVDASLLIQFLEQSILREELRQSIGELFTTKEHNWSAIRAYQEKTIQ